MNIYKNTTSFSKKDMFESLRAWHIRNEVQAFFEQNQAIVRHTIVRGNLEARMEKKHFGPQDSVYTWILWYNETIGSSHHAPGEFSYAPFEIKIYLQYQGTSDRTEPTSDHRIYIATIRLLECSHWNMARELNTHFGILSEKVLSPVLVKERFEGWMTTFSMCRNYHEQTFVQRSKNWFSGDTALESDPRVGPTVHNNFKLKRMLDPEFDRRWCEWAAEQDFFADF